MNSKGTMPRNECPSEQMLQAYLDDELNLAETDLVEDHLAACDICFLSLTVLQPSKSFSDPELGDQASPAEESTGNVPEWVVQHAREFAERRNRIESNVRSREEVLNKEGIKSGQVWRTKLDNIITVTAVGQELHSFEDFGSAPKLVVICDGCVVSYANHNVVQAFPLHPTIGLEKEDDLFADIKSSPTGYPFYIQGWNSSDVLVENLDACLGQIDFAQSPALAVELRKLSTIRYLPSVSVWYAGEKIEIPPTGFNHDSFARDFKTDPITRFRYAQYCEAAYLRVPGELLKETAAAKATKLSWFAKALNFGRYAGSFVTGRHRITVFSAVAVLFMLVLGLFYVNLERRSKPEIANEPEIDLPNRTGVDETIANRSTNSDDERDVNSTGNTNLGEERKRPVPKTGKPGSLERKKGSDSRKQPIDPTIRFAQFDRRSNDTESEPNRERTPSYDWSHGRFEPGIQFPKKERATRDNSRGVMIGALTDSAPETPKFLSTNSYSNLYLKPSGTYVKTLNPTLSWIGIKGAESYAVAVYDSRFNLVSETNIGRIKGRSVLISTKLEPGQQYHWTLTPFLNDGRPMLRENQEIGASFQTLNDDQLVRVSEAEFDTPRPSLKLAAVYLRYALFDDAIQELENYLSDHPDSKEAKKMLVYARNPKAPDYK